MMPDEPTDEERQEQLPQDNETPFRPAAPNPDPSVSTPTNAPLDDTHPVTDTNIQPSEQYDEGVSGAAEAAEPNAGNSVVSFTPPNNSNDPAGQATGNEPASAKPVPTTDDSPDQ